MSSIYGARIDSMRTEPKRKVSQQEVERAFRAQAKRYDEKAQRCLKIAEAVGRNETYTEIAARYGVSRQHVYQLVSQHIFELEENSRDAA
jgi:DNA-directed RNA polymerase specialized sigma subunit